MRKEQLISVLETVGLHVVYDRCTSAEVVIICPQCNDSSGNRSVSTSTLLTNCWRCHVGGPLAGWSRKAGYPIDLENIEAPSSIKVDEMAEVIESLDQVGVPVKPSGYVPSVILPRGFTRVIDDPNCAYSRLIGKMAIRKGLNFDILSKAGVGYTKLDRKWEPFAIFPVFEWERPVYYQGRTYIDLPGASTKLFPTNKECPISSKFWLYNIDKVPQIQLIGGIIILVESILNVLSLEVELAHRQIVNVVPVAVFKHKLSSPQREKLIATMARARLRGNPVKEVCVMYDGRTKDEIVSGKTGDAAITAREDASALSSVVSTSVVDLPDKLDPNDNPSLAVNYFLNRKPYNRIQCVVPTY